MTYDPHAAHDSPAPVVSDDVAEPGRPRPAIAPRSRHRRGAGLGRLPALPVLLAILAAIWTLTLSVEQVASEQAALPSLDRLTVALTDVDALIALHGGEVRAQAAASEPQLTLPAYPLPDVRVALDAGAPSGVFDATAFRRALLEQSARDLYLRGTDAFAADADTGTDLGDNAGVRLLLAVLSAPTHDRATMLLWVMTAVTLVALVVTARRGGGTQRHAIVGPAIVGLALVAAAALAAAAALLTWAAGAILGIGPAGVVGDAYGDITSALVRVPLRNAVILAAVGVSIAVMPLGLRILAGPAGTAAGGIDASEDAR